MPKYTHSPNQVRTKLDIAIGAIEQLMQSCNTDSIEFSQLNQVRTKLDIAIGAIEQLMQSCNTDSIEFSQLNEIYWKIETLSNSVGLVGLPAPHHMIKGED